MKANIKLTLAVLVGITIGVAGAAAIHARQVKVPPAYVISEVEEFGDLPALQKYGGKVEETLASFSHHFIVRGGKTQCPANRHCQVLPDVTVIGNGAGDATLQQVG
jgi:hypothetical protein